MNQMCPSMLYLGCGLPSLQNRKKFLLLMSPSLFCCSNPNRVRYLPETHSAQGSQSYIFWNDWTEYSVSNKTTWQMSSVFWTKSQSLPNPSRPWIWPLSFQSHLPLFSLSFLGSASCAHLVRSLLLRWGLCQPCCPPELCLLDRRQTFCYWLSVQTFLSENTCSKKVPWPSLSYSSISISW